MPRPLFPLLLAAWSVCCWNTALAREPAGRPEAGAASQLQVQIDFPGGSGTVETIDQQQRLIRLTPTEHPDRGWVCWWYIQVTGIRPGETITLDVGNAPWATPDRAAVSTDNGHWEQTEAGQRQGRRIRYQHQVDAERAWFAWGPPFVPEDAERLVRWAAEASPHAEAFELCRTRADRPVPALRIEQPGTADRQRWGIWIHARQHAWESGSSWVCRGLVQWLVSDDPRAEQLRTTSQITIVPVMDIDNVALGAGGKNQVPHDHNRDWSETPHFPSVAAAMEQIQRLDAEGQFDMFIDLHNPGAGSKAPFYFIAPRKLLAPLGVRNLDRFLAASRQEITGPLAFRGETHESGANYDKLWKQISKNWVMLHCREHVLSVTLETAWNTPHSTTEGYQTVGRQLGLAIERYFGTDPRQE